MHVCVQYMYAGKRYLWLFDSQCIRPNGGVTERCKCCSLSACISGWIKERNKLSGSPSVFLWQDRRRKEEGDYKRGCSVEDLSDRCHVKRMRRRKKKIRLLCNSVFTQNTHTHDARTASLLFVKMQLFANYLYSCGLVIQDRGALCPNLSYKF